MTQRTKTRSNTAIEKVSRTKAESSKRQIFGYPIDKLILDPENARKHSELDIDSTASSLSRFGQATPIVVTTADATGKRIIVKGNGTTLAAMKLGWIEIECIETNLTGDELRAYAIADNQTGQLASWDLARLAEQVASFEEDLRACIGFSQQQIDEMLIDAIGNIPAPEPEVIDEPTEPLQPSQPETSDMVVTSFPLTVQQDLIIKQALKAARSLGAENNSIALTLIAKAFIDGQASQEVAS